jgi:hypothetical protein
MSKEQIRKMAGRPKRVFSDEEKAKIKEMALNNCRDNTIAGALDIPINSFKRHFGKLCKKKRTEFRTKLRAHQAKLAETNPAMAIFLGKNELNQTDKQIVEHEESAQRQLAEKERLEADRIAKIRLMQPTG